MDIHRGRPGSIKYLGQAYRYQRRGMSHTRREHTVGPIAPCRACITPGLCLDGIFSYCYHPFDQARDLISCLWRALLAAYVVYLYEPLEPQAFPTFVLQTRLTHISDIISAMLRDSDSGL